MVANIKLIYAFFVAPFVITSSFNVKPASTEVCNSTRFINATANGLASGYIINDGYPDKIDNFSSCSWVITARPGYIIQFETLIGSIGDYWGSKNQLSITDAVGNIADWQYFESYTNGTYLTMSHIATVRFYTENRVNLYGHPLGFMIKYKEVFMNSSDQIQIIENSANGTIKNDNYPNYYAPKSRQAWRIIADPGKIISLSLSTASMIEELKIYDGPDASEEILLLHVAFSNYETSLFSNSNEVFIALQTTPIRTFSDDRFDSRQYPHGFTLNYQQVAADAAKPCQSIRKLSAKEMAFGTITNDYYDYGVEGKAEANSNCGWIVESSPGTKIGFAFARLSLVDSNGTCWGNVSVYDGETLSSPLVASVCSPLPGYFYVNGSSALVIFQSLPTMPVGIMPAFELNYWEETLEAVICPDVVQVTSTSGRITSNGYPGRYDASTVPCRWNITVDSGYIIRMKLSIGSIDEWNYFGSNFDCSFEMSYGSPFINVYSPSLESAKDLNISYCNDYYEPQLLTPSNTAMVSFLPGEHSTSYNEFISYYFNYPLGFSLTYEQVLPEKRSPCREVRTLSPSSNAILGIIRSDYYPKWYESDIDCQWLIQAPPGYVIIFNWVVSSLLENDCGDSLVLYDGSSVDHKRLDKFCGKCGATTYADYYTTSNVGLVHFKTAPGTTFGERHEGSLLLGFSINYQAVPAPANPACRQTTFIYLSESSSMSGVIENIGYPDTYEAFSSCSWRIIAPSADYRLRFNVTLGVFGGFSDDLANIVIQDGSRCFTLLYENFISIGTNRTVWSLSSSAIITFVSGKVITQPTPGLPFGFHIDYEAVQLPKPEPDPEDLTWLWILIGVLSGTVLISVLGLLAYKAFKSKKEPVKQQQQTTVEMK